MNLRSPDRFSWTWVSRSAVCILLAAALLVTAPAVLPALAAGTGSSQSTDAQSTNAATLLQVYQLLNQYYVNQPDSRTMTQDAIQQLIQSAKGDPYTVYYTPSEYQSFQNDVSGQYTGVGIVIQQQQNQVVVVKPLAGGPAAKAGIQAGDVITAVNGKSISGKGLDAVSSLIRGPEGSKVTLTIRRQSKQFDVTVTRQQLQVPTVDAKMVDQHTGYISLSQFDQNSDQEVHQAVQSLVKQGATEFILDLRNNPGGLLNVAVNIAGEFAPQGPVVYVRGRNGQNQELDSSNSSFHWPVFVLVNNYSASAAEIVSAAIRDDHTGLLVGQKTFGKGTVQSVVPLSNGGALKLTVAHDFSPAGTSWDQSGLQPQVAAASDQALTVAEKLAQQVQAQSQQWQNHPKQLTLVPGTQVAIYQQHIYHLSSQPLKRGGATYLPLRGVAVMMGFDVKWDASTNSVLLIKGDQEILLHSSGAWESRSDKRGQVNLLHQGNHLLIKQADIDSLLSSSS